MARFDGRSRAVVGVAARAGYREAIRGAAEGGAAVRLTSVQGFKSLTEAFYQLSRDSCSLTTTNCVTFL